MKNQVKGFYCLIISEAINVTDQAILNEVEDIMRNVIFHSTLDWQTKGQLIKGAKEAHVLYNYMQTDEYKKQLEDMFN